MKKETVITAVVFLVVGFLAGYITDAQLNWSARQKAAAGMSGVRDEPPGGGTASSAASGGVTSQGLPEGHPPIDPTAVISSLQEETARNPKSPEPRLKLANFLYDQRQYQQAIEWYQKALELDPRNVNARTDLGTCYFSLGRGEDALREYRRSLEVDPKHEPTMFNMIVVNIEGTRDLAAAGQAWEKLHKLNPNYPGLDRLKISLAAARGSATGAPTRR